MADADYSFAQARTRLEDIVTQVRKKDVSLEKSLDLLEEGVRLANACTERIDHTEWRSVAAEPAESGLDEEAGLDAQATGPEDPGADMAPERTSADQRSGASDLPPVPIEDASPVDLAGESDRSPEGGAAEE